MATMTTARAVADRPLDPSLLGLPEVLSAHPPGAGPGEKCRVRHVEWTPGRSCRVVHEVRGDRASALLVHEVTAGGMVVRSMCPDPALPGLPLVLDGGQMQERIAAVLGGAVLSGPAVPVAYRPGARAVVAYDLLRPRGGSRLFVKLLAEGPERSAAACAAIAEAARRSGQPVPVPEVVAVWPDLGAVVQRAAPGRGLSGMLSDPSASGSGGVQICRRLGRLLGTVHSTPLGAERAWTVDDELGQLEVLLAPAWHADSAAGRSLAAMLDRLADRAPVAGEVVLAHGAFRTGQVRVERGRLRLVDLDTACSSHPARDVGNALAYLDWADLRNALQPGLVPSLHDALLSGYAASRDRLDDRALRWWTAAAMAKISGRRYRSLETSQWPRVPLLLARAMDLLDAVPVRRGSSGKPLPAGALDAARVTWGQGVAPRVVASQPLTEAAGRRRVVRYLVEGLGGPATTALIGKAHDSRHRAFIAHENLRLLGQQVFNGTAGLGVPRVVCRIPSLGMVLYREVGGRSADVLDGPAAVRAAESAGRWLTALHTSSVVLIRRVDLGHEVANAEEWATQVAAAAPKSRRAVFDLVNRLADAAARLPATREVPVHKDLHAGHVLAPHGGRGGVVVIDLDEARMGDPAIDVAHFCAYLDASRKPAASAMRDAFLTGYGPLPGEAPELRVCFYGAYTAIKIAKQFVGGSGPLRPPAGPARARALDRVLARGLACLAT